MRQLRRATLALGLATLVSLLAGVVFVASPLPRGFTDYRPVASVKILDREGGLLRELLSRSDGRSTPIASDQLPDHLKAAFLAAEDKGFYGHYGVSPSAIARAAWQNLRAGKVVSGGSTLTQQLARNLVPRERTLLGKVREALWALRLEAHLSKEEILVQYLNRIPFGNGTFGVEAASSLYFGRRAHHLSLAQAAALASIPRGPTAYNPYRSPHRLRSRQHWVLQRMSSLGFIDEASASRAGQEPLDLSVLRTTFRAPHFVEFVAANLERWGLGEAVEVRTSLDPSLQQAVEDDIQQELHALSDRRVGSASVVVVDNATSEILAYQGSADFFDASSGGQNDGVQMRRQPGSALKPFVYGEALAKLGYTPASVIADVETHFAGRAGVYAPKNYDRRNHGPVRLREALANSYNVPAVKVAEALGPERVLRVLQAAGFGSLTQGAEHYGLGLTLGNGEVSLWESASAYAGLSRGGVLKPLRCIQSAKRADGTPIELSPSPSRRFLEPRSAALVTHILSDNGARARAFGLDNALRLGFPVAAKTGTSKGYSDNWTIGYTRERTVGVWAGNFDGTPMVQVSGMTGAAPIFKRVMTRAMNGRAGEALVSHVQLESAAICPLSGERASAHCPASMDEWFVPGTAPARGCAMHAGVAEHLPADLVEPCRKLAGPQGRLVDLGPDYYEWSRAQGFSPQPWLSSLCRERQSPSGTPTIVFPASGDEFLLIADLPLEDQAIPLRVRAAADVERLDVRLDGQPLLALAPPFSSRFFASPGEHVLTLHRAGEAPPIGSVRFRVRSGQ